jgi:hypothetical protein
VTQPASLVQTIASVLPSAMPTLASLEAAESVFERRRPEMEALKEEELAIVNVDVGVASSIAYSASPKIVALRGEILDVLPAFPVVYIDGLVEYAQAAWYAHVTGTSVTPGTDLAPLVAEATQLRAKLLLWGTPLAAEGLIDAATLERIRAGSGYMDTASDLAALVALYRARWDEVNKLTSVTEADLHRGAHLSSILWGAASLRDNDAITRTPAESALRVRRAWTLLDRAYTECRRAVQYVRYKPGEVDLIAPSLRRSPSRTQRTQAAPEEQPPVDPAPSLPTGPAIGDGSSPFIKP